MAEELLTARQVAARLHIHPRTVVEWGRAGKIPEIRLSERIRRYDWQAVLTALQAAPTSEGAADE